MDGDQFNYKFVVTGTFEGDEGEHIDKERILDVARMSDKSKYSQRNACRGLN